MLTHLSPSQTNSFPKKVRIVEVGPRDGLQNESRTLNTSTKISLIEKLADAGLDYIEAGSFVNPKWVPQMADSAQVFENISRNKNVTYAALIPNLQGFERALAVNANEVAIFAAASEAFSQKNINCSVNESLKRFEQVMLSAQQHNISVRGYISCIAGCPYSGEVDPARVADIAHALLAMGCREISLGDTIGVGTAEQTKKIVSCVANKIPLETIAVHLHDTYGQALTNVYAAMQLGVNVVDTSIAGLGGCPYAPGAAGNLATEDLVYLLNGLEIAHGVNFPKLIEAGNFICTALNRPNQSKAALATQTKR